MNKRQAKKNFKKKYGFNPKKDKNGKYMMKEYEAILQVDWAEVGKALSDACKTIEKGIMDIADQLSKALCKTERNKKEESVVNTARILSERRKGYE